MPDLFKTAEPVAEELARALYVPNPLLRNEEFCYDWLTSVWWSQEIGEDPLIKLRPILSAYRKQYLPIVTLIENLTGEEDDEPQA